jgi:hypothetical protein
MKMNRINTDRSRKVTGLRPKSRRARLHDRLRALQAAGVVTDWYCQSGMPGLRWTVWGPGWEISRGTRETEDYLAALSVR